jgi:hypothetical protein
MNRAVIYLSKLKIRKVELKPEFWVPELVST